VAPCRCSGLNRRFGGSCGCRTAATCSRWFFARGFFILKMEAIRSSETSVQSTTSTRRHTPEDGFLHSHRRENLKSYKTYSVGPEIGTSSIDWAQQSRFYLKTETESSLRNVQTGRFLDKDKTMDNVQKHNTCIGQYIRNTRVDSWTFQGTDTQRTVLDILTQFFSKNEFTWTEM
jgi:hypothetical protein